MPSLLCCPLLVHDLHRAHTDALAARDLGADLVEYRLDDYFTGGSGDTELAAEITALSRLVADSPLPCIATCRPTWEGGAYDGPEDARISLFEALGTLAPPRGHPPRYIDVELAAYSRSANIRQKIHLAVDHPARARDLAPSLILSIHDFTRRPPDLTRRLLAARESGASRVLKIAYHARSLRDNLELFDILDARDRPTIALGMGEFGLISRILAPKFGAFLTFASLRPTQTTAPGQPTLSDILHTYRFRAIKPTTRVYGIVGWPVAHSLSPQLHNAGFEAIGFDGVYVPLPIPASSATDRDEPSAPASHHTPDDAYLAFKATMLSLIDHPRLDFSGCSVTIPHKQNLVRLAREQNWHIDPVAAASGAANTLAIDRDLSSAPRAIRILNTDALAARQCLESALGDLADKRIALLGAGGVARAITAACPDACITLFARNPAQSAQLASDLSSMPRCLPASMPSSSSSSASPPPHPILTAPLHTLPDQPYDAIINCTPLGMLRGPDPSASPCDVPAIAARHPRTTFFDTVYNPALTPFLTAARAAGCTTIPGLDMLTRQAAAQFTAWTNTPAPSALFARIAAESLSPPGP